LTPELIRLKQIEAWQSGGAQVPKFVGNGGGSNFLLQLDNK